MTEHANNAKFNIIEKNIVEFIEMFRSINAAIERLSREVTSLQLSSVQKEDAEPLVREFEAENELDDVGDLDEFNVDENRYRSRDRRNERRY